MGENYSQIFNSIISIIRPEIDFLINFNGSSINPRTKHLIRILCKSIYFIKISLPPFCFLLFVCCVCFRIVGEKVNKLLQFFMVAEKHGKVYEKTWKVDSNNGFAFINYSIFVIYETNFVCSRAASALTPFKVTI